MARLPKVGGDIGDWGTVLNQFLRVSHNSDGTLQSSAIRQAGGVTSVNGKTPSSGTITLAAKDVGAYVKPSTGIPASDLDASTQSDLTAASTAVQLGGDLGGTNTAPVVTKLQGTTVNAASPTANQVLSYNGSQWVPAAVTSTTVNDATPSTPGIIQLDGDLGGTATSPTVAKINGITLPGSAPTASGQVLTTTGSGTGSGTAWSTPAAGVALDTAAGDIQADTTTGVAIAGSTGKAADAGHQHPLAAHNHTSANQGGQIPVAGISASGTASSATYLRGDGTWDTPPTASDATSSAPGLIQLDGDLGGTATNPTVAKINGVSVSGTASAGQVLTATGSNAAVWQTGAYVTWNVVLKSAAYTANSGDFVHVTVGGASVTSVVITLPATSQNATVKIKRTDLPAVTTANASINFVLIQTPDGSLINGSLSSCTIADYGETVQLTCDGTNWWTDDAFAPYHNVRRYGARLDNTTDDTTAIQNAINMGGITFFPAGHGNISQISLLSDSKLIGTGHQGAGGNAPITQFTRLGPTASTTATYMIEVASTCSHAHIEDIDFIGTAHSNSPYTVAGLYSPATSGSQCNLDIWRCGFLDFAGDGVQINQEERANGFYTCDFYNNGGYGLNIVSASDSVIDLGCNFTGNGSDGLFVAGEMTRVSNSNCYGNTNNGATIDSAMMIIDSVSFDQNQKAGLVVGSSTTHLKLVTCRFDANSLASSGTYPHIDVSQNTTNLLALTLLGCAFPTLEYGDTQTVSYCVYTGGSAAVSVYDHGSTWVASATANGQFCDEASAVHISSGVMQAKTSSRVALALQQASGQTAYLQAFLDSSSNFLGGWDNWGRPIMSTTPSMVPSTAVQTAAGSGASASISGNDISGAITLVTGTSPTSGALVNVTLAHSFPSAVNAVTLTAHGSTAAGVMSEVYVTQSGGTTWVLNASAAPAANATYTWYYAVTGR